MSTNQRQYRVMSGKLIQSHNVYIRGNNNIIFGNSAHVIGNGNQVFGNFAQVSGNSNLLFGNYIQANGISNRVFGNSARVVGNSNRVTGNDAEVLGVGNEVRESTQALISKEMLRADEDEANPELSCHICYTYRKSWVLNCGHTYCAHCIAKMHQCPQCRQDICNVSRIYI